MKNNLWVYDLETYKYMFLACFKNVETGQWERFEISNRKNDIKKLYQFLAIKNLELIGFNNLEFDYPVLHNTILSKRKRWSSVEIYNEANNIIEAEYSSIWDKYVKVPQIDLFAIKHYKNPARSTSLKWLEYAMRMDNIEDLPFDPSIELTSLMMDKIIEYCDHDVNATELFYHECSKDIELRKQLSKVYNLDLTNANDPKIGSEIFLDLLSKEMKVDKWDLKNERTYRRKINFKDIIIPYVKYDTPEMNRVLNAFKNYSTGEGVKDFEISGKIGNIVNDFGQGGLHGCTDPGVYESTKDRVIIDIDVNKAAS